MTTTPPVALRAIQTLFRKAMEDGHQAKQVGTFILSLWSPEKYPLNLDDVAYFEGELNSAARHLINFLIGCQVQFRQLVTFQEVEPIIAAWAQEITQ